MDQPLTPEQQQLLSTTPYSWIYERIGHGAEDATPAEAILFGHTLTDRELRKCIETLRNEGIVIASGNMGYYFPGDYNDLKKYIQKTSKAAKSLFKSLKAARRMLREMEERRYDGT